MLPEAGGEAAHLLGRGGTPVAQELAKQSPLQRSGEEQPKSPACVHDKTGLNLVIVATLKTVTVLAWLAMCIFMFGLPHWSNVANLEYWDFKEDWRAPTGLCSIDPSLFKCADGRNFSQLAEAAGRLGCGCGQGIFGEALCPLTPTGISLSSLIGTATGSGCFMLFTAVPMMAMWLHVAQIHYACTCRVGKVDLWNLGMISLLTFQVLMASIAAIPACIWGVAHALLTVAAFVFLAVHMFVLAITSCRLLGSKAAIRITLCMGLPGALAYPLISEGGGIWFQHSPNAWNEAMYHYGECVSLALTMGIAPLLMIMGQMDDFLYGGLR